MGRTWSHVVVSVSVLAVVCCEIRGEWDRRCSSQKGLKKVRNESGWRFFVVGLMFGVKGNGFRVCG